jgi:hypothetical protein
MLRISAAAGALAIAVTWAVLNQQMSAETNAVERFHFLEYGFMTWLFYRAAQGPSETTGPVKAADLSWVALPMLAGVIVGTADEALQWFVPRRVGEIRDVFLNLAAVGAGLLMSLAVDPPETFRVGLVPSSRRRLAVAAASAILALAGFLHAVHLGHRVANAEIGVFLSRYSAEELRTLSADRSARWRAHPPPLDPGRLSREDQYLFEANRHVQQRNEAWTDDARRAWFENRVLEAYFAPALDFPSYAVPAGSKWPAAQRADAEARMMAAEPEPFASRALAGFILVWSQFWLWAGAGALAGGILLIGFVRAGRV